MGTCFLCEFQDNAKAEIGYELSQEYWNRGITTEVAQRVLEYGFDTLNLVRIQAIYNPENVASQKLLEKLGFEKEGLLKKYEFHTRIKETQRCPDVFAY